MSDGIAALCAPATAVTKLNRAALQVRIRDMA
jgi:hypothetical protein